ncbi:MAG TPA: hypothetical protein VF384_01820 [Planctomycetota bacterium]
MNATPRNCCMVGFALSLLLGAALVAQDAATAADVTEPGRTLERPLEIVLAGRGAEATERTLIVIVDPSAGLAAAGFADAFERAVAQNARWLAKTRFGLGVLGHKGCVVLPPGAPAAAVVAEIKNRLAKPAAEFQNVYADLRGVAAAFSGESGAREILLVTLENGDLEDDLEQTAAALQKARVTVAVLTSEATLADSWWVSRSYQEKPRGTTLAGGDAPVIDLPWGWLFQVPIANEITPAGYAAYGLNRVAAATGGKVFLYANANQTAHVCGISAECLFCTGEHLPQHEGFRDALLRRMAPSTAPRTEACATLAHDPWFRLVVRAWLEAADEGLIRSTPSVKLVGTSAQPERQKNVRVLDLLSSASFARHAKRAEQAAEAAGKLGASVQSDLDRLEPGTGLQRCEAAAHLTRFMIQLSRVNLLTFAAWCREDAPRLFGKDAEDPALPEIPVVEGDRQPAGIGFTNLVLCHGVRPFLGVELPGGAALRPELEKLELLRLQFVARYGNTPFSFALHKAGIAEFHATFPGVTQPPPRRRPKSGEETGPTTPSRPERGRPTTGGTTGGPTSGGGR